MKINNVLKIPSTKRFGKVSMGTDAGMDRTIFNPIFKEVFNDLKAGADVPAHQQLYSFFSK